MIITPNIDLTDRQFLALQQLAMEREMTVEQLIARNVVMLAVKQITKDQPINQWIVNYGNPDA